MQKLVRYRKAFYEKENDLQHGNQRKERLPHPSKSALDKAYLTLPLTISLSPKEHPHVHPHHNVPKNNTALFCSLYGEPLSRLPEYQQHQPDFLRRHSIDSTLRARMLDWMVEVTSSYKFSHKTYFDGVALMDRYFQAEPQSLAPGKLHLIGVQCMLIASKMEEVFPLKIKTVYEKIAHRKLGLGELVQTEERIMRMLECKLNSWTFFDVAMLRLAIFSGQSDEERGVLRPLGENAEVGGNQSAGGRQLKNLEEICSYLSKFVIMDYTFYIQTTTILLAQSLTKAVMQIASILPPSNFFVSSPILIELTKQRILKNVRTHSSRFNGLNNIFKFTPAEVVAQVEKYMD